jgi:hypothetical protein
VASSAKVVCHCPELREELRIYCPRPFENALADRLIQVMGLRIGFGHLAIPSMQLVVR